MRIIILERNLIWSSRLVNAAKTLGHEAQVMTELPEVIEADVAIINLAEPDTRVFAPLASAGVKIVAHAGHKEKDKLQLGKSAGCDLVVTNSELTFKLADILEKVTSPAQLDA
jgi:hypothetical protein